MYGSAYWISVLGNWLVHEDNYKISFEEQQRHHNIKSKNFII